MSTYFTANMNFQNDCASPITPPPSSSLENSFLVKCFRPGLPSDYSSSYLNRPIVNYYRNTITGSGGSSSGSNRTPLSPLENLELSPLVKVEEDVLVMESVLVNSKSGSKCGSGGEKFSLSTSSGSGGSLYKTELCKSWEDSGYFRYGIKCQFAHGQEEPRAFPNRTRNMKKLEMTKPKSMPLSNPYSPSNVISPDKTATTPPSVASSTSKPKKPSPPLSKSWSPMADGITVSLPGSSSTDQPPTSTDVDKYIDNILYGPTNRKRLSFFRDICPE